MDQIVSKSKFKPNALKYFREVESTGKPIIISDRGKPVIKIVPYVDPTFKRLADLRNTILEYVDPLEPVGASDWEALE